MIKKLHSNQRMSKTVIHNQTIYLCGQVGNAEDDIKAQTLTCLEKIQPLLEEEASDKLVIAAGPWSNDLIRPLGYNLPLFPMRGYHQHFKVTD